MDRIRTNLENDMSLILKQTPGKEFYLMYNFIGAKLGDMGGTVLNLGQPRSCNYPCLCIYRFYKENL